MATKESLGIREENAVNRIVVSLETLAAEAKLEPPAFEKVPKVSDRQTYEVRRLETTADFLESLVVVSVPEITPEPPKGKKVRNGTDKK